MLFKFFLLALVIDLLGLWGEVAASLAPLTEPVELLLFVEESPVAYKEFGTGAMKPSTAEATTNYHLIVVVGAVADALNHGRGFRRWSVTFSITFLVEDRARVCRVFFLIFLGEAFFAAALIIDSSLLSKVGLDTFVTWFTACVDTWFFLKLEISIRFAFTFNFSTSPSLECVRNLVSRNRNILKCSLDLSNFIFKDSLLGILSTLPHQVVFSVRAEEFLHHDRLWLEVRSLFLKGIHFHL